MSELTELEDFTTKVEKTEDGYVITNIKKPTQDIGEPPVANTKIEVIKYAEDTNQPLKGAEITLFDENDEIVLEVYIDKPCVAVTDENGKVTFYVDSYKYKNIYAKETKAPEGYLINKEKFNIELVDGENWIENTSIDIYDKPIEPKKTIINVEVVKYAEDSKLPLKDAEITLFSENDEIVKGVDGNDCIALTGKDGKVTFQVYKEDYPSIYAIETKAPEGYRINADKHAVDMAGKILNVSVAIYDSPITPNETPEPTIKPTPEITSTPTPAPKTIVDTSYDSNISLYGLMFIGSLLVLLFTSLKLIRKR